MTFDLKAVLSSNGGRAGSGAVEFRAGRRKLAPGAMSDCISSETQPKAVAVGRLGGMVMARLVPLTKPRGDTVFVNPQTVTMVVVVPGGAKGLVRVCYPGGDFVDVTGELKAIADLIGEGLG